MKDDSLHPMESLQLIDSMINKARNRFSENGHLYLLWGWVVFVCSTGHYILQNIFRAQYSWTIWFLTWIALIYQVIYLSKRRKKENVRTYTDDIINYVWIVFVVCTLLAVMVSLRFISHANDTNDIILVMYGMPTFLSGAILKFKPLIAGAFCCWLLAISTLIVPVEYHMLLVSAAVVTAWIIPGYMLRAHYQKNKL